MDTLIPYATLKRVTFAMSRYGLVGIICAILNLGIVYIGHDILGCHYVVAVLSTCLITIPVSYFLHRQFTFDSVGSADFSQFQRFCITQLSQFLIGALMLVAIVEISHWHVIIAMLLVTLIQFIYGFIISSTWVFGLFLGMAQPGTQGTTRCAEVPTPPSATQRRLEQPRILQVSAFFAAHGGGIEAVADALARHLAASGVEILWMAGGPPGERPAESLPDDFKVEQAVSVDLTERSLGIPFPLWGLGSITRLWRHISQADIVHLHDYLYMPTLIAAICAKIQRKPLVLTQHIGDIPFKSLVARTLLRILNHSVGALVLSSASRVIFVSQPVQDYFSAFVRFRRAPRLIANGVDRVRYHPADRDTKPADPVKLLFVGRFVEKKGLHLLQQCVDLPGTCWTFIGRGPNSPSDWNMPSADVQVLGAMPPEQVVSHYQQADLLVLPSTGEGFPLVVQEALACGTPVLVSREVAEAFPIQDARCVFDVELRVPHPAQALRNAVSQIVKDPNRLTRARPHAHALASQWSWESCSQQYRAIYDEQLVR